MERDFILEMNSITKTYPGVKALDDVTFRVERGKVNTLIGENGAGKSTLMNILSGATRADSGEILLNGERIHISYPEDSIRNGISMIYQELNLVQDMTVAENIFLGAGSGSGILFSKKKVIEKAEQLLSSYNMNISPSAYLRDLSLAKQQMVEIAKALSKNVKILIMDEPTSSLSISDTEHLFKLIKSFKEEQGVTVIYISHRMEEIFSIGDTVTVLCDGRNSGSWDLADTDVDKLISSMVGREITQLFPKEHVDIGETVFAVKDLTKPGYFKDVSFKVRRGEIVGMAGLIGAGRTEICQSIFGAMHYTGGTVEINGRAIHNRHPDEAMKNRIAYVPEDRKLMGLNLASSVRNNISLTNEGVISKLGYILKHKENQFADEMIKKLRIKCSSKLQLVRDLSGGNQQKVVLAKWIARDIDVLILDEPTRGVDVGAKQEIHSLIVEFAKAGLAIILVSSELPEILGMSDRIVVIHEGKVSGILEASSADQEQVMKYAAGQGSETVLQE